MSRFDTLIQKAIQNGGSDIHAVEGERPAYRVHGTLTYGDDTPLSREDLGEALQAYFSEPQRKQFEETHELDAAVMAGGARFRMNVHMQDGRTGIAARYVPSEIPTPDALGFEPVLRRFSALRDGLVLVVGPTGSGKSTTIAALIEEINKTEKRHIISIEDPVEFVFQDKESLIEQREIGRDTQSFAEGLKHVLRQDPDVILVGEMRDPETIATVLTAAETGHLVFSTLHTGSAPEAVARIADVFDGPKQHQVLMQASSVLRAVVAQHLLPAADGTRVAAREILINTPAVANLIRENTIAQIKSVIETGANEGMHTMAQSVGALLEQGRITNDVAQRWMA